MFRSKPRYLLTVVERATVWLYFVVASANLWCVVPLRLDLPLSLDEMNLGTRSLEPHFSFRRMRKTIGSGRKDHSSQRDITTPNLESTFQFYIQSVLSMSIKSLSSLQTVVSGSGGHGCDVQWVHRQTTIFWLTTSFFLGDLGPVYNRDALHLHLTCLKGTRYALWRKMKGKNITTPNWEHWFEASVYQGTVWLSSAVWCIGKPLFLERTFEVEENKSRIWHHIFIRVASDFHTVVMTSMQCVYILHAWRVRGT